MLLTSKINHEDAIILFADLQAGIADLPLTVTQDQLRKGVLGLAKLAKVLQIPAIVTAVAEGGQPAKIMPEIERGYGEALPIHYRTTADSFLNDEIKAAIEASGRKTILISGVATELAVQLPALSGVDLGYRTYVVVDACGGISQRTEQAALSRVTSNGGNLTCVMTLAGELAGDFRTPEAQAAVGILFEMAASA